MIGVPVVSDSYDPMDCSPPGSSVHGITQATILEWVAISSSRDLRDPGIELESLTSPALAGRLFTVGAALVLALEDSASACESLYKARLWGAHSIRASLQWETLWAPECAGPMFSSEALGQAGAGEQCGPPRLIPFRFKKSLGFWDSQRRGSS